MSHHPARDGSVVVGGCSGVAVIDTEDIDAYRFGCRWGAVLAFTLVSLAVRISGVLQVLA